MKTRTYILLIFLCSSHPAFLQIDVDTVPRLDLYKITLINPSDSYITFPTDIMNIEPLLFEANVNPSFVIRDRNDAKLMAVLTAQITLRMYIMDSILCVHQAIFHKYHFIM